MSIQVPTLWNVYVIEFDFKISAFSKKQKTYSVCVHKSLYLNYLRLLKVLLTPDTGKMCQIDFVLIAGQAKDEN